MVVRTNFHAARSLDRGARILIGSLAVLVIVLCFSAGSAWSTASAPLSTALTQNIPH